jgi:hypothetical protein
MGMIDGHDYRGVFLSCKDCGSLFGRGGRLMQELVEEGRQKRKESKDRLREKLRRQTGRGLRDE